MDTQTFGTSESQVFEPSKNSQLGKTFKWIWLALAVSIAVLLATNKGSLTGLLVGIGGMFVLMGIIHLTLRSQFSKHRTRVTIDATQIACLGFAGPIKKYALSGVSSASIEVIGGVPVLQLRLHEASGIKDKKSFLNGRNPARPYFGLGPYSPEDQEKMLDAICLRLANNGLSDTKPPIINSLRTEREFQEKLKAFAPRTWVTYGLLTANVAIWAVTVAMGADVLKPSSELLFQSGGNTAFAVQTGQWWRLLSATFLHAGIIHLGMNMLGLVVVGVTLERLFGHKLFLLIYLVSGLAGSALSMHYAAQKAVSVGASGAIFGIAGALLVAVFKHRKTLPQMFSKQTLSGMGFFVVYSLAQGFGRTGTDNAAHIGGLLAGCLMAAILSSRLDKASSSVGNSRRVSLAVLTAALLVPILGATANTSDFDVRRAIDGSAAFTAGMKSLTSAQEALKKEQSDVKAGKLTERDADNRSRTEHAPAFIKISAQLSAAWFLPGDQRNEVLKEVKYAVELMTEALAMESNFPDGSTKAEPADPARQLFIESEITKTNLRLEALSKKTASQKGNVKNQ